MILTVQSARRYEVKNMKLRFQVNHMPVDAEYTDQDIQEIFLPLVENLTLLQREKGSRLFVMLAAPPACGKTTLSKFLSHLSYVTPGMSHISVIGMDGFHRYMSYLTTHTTMRDGEEIPMVNVKGSPVTFDLPRLTQFVREVAEGTRNTWPDYDRMKKDPVEDAITIDKDIVLLEGNYLLMQEPGWEDLASYADTTIKITAEPAFLRERLIKRKHATGTPMEESVAFVDYSDMVNVKTCLEKTGEADYELRITSDGRYHVQSPAAFRGFECGGSGEICPLPGSTEKPDEKTIRELVSEAFKILPNAYAPYSHFHVAAAVLASSGKIYAGVNVENASYPAGICAERNAIFHAAAAGERKITAIVILGGKDGIITDYTAPCGICRQVMREFADPDTMKIYLAKTPEDYKEYTLKELLPESFGPENLA